MYHLKFCTIKKFYVLKCLGDWSIFQFVTKQNSYMEPGEVNMGWSCIFFIPIFSTNFFLWWLFFWVFCLFWFCYFGVSLSNLMSYSALLFKNVFSCYWGLLLWVFFFFNGHPAYFLNLNYLFLFCWLLLNSFS